MKKNIFLILFSLIFSFFIIELFLSIFLPQDLTSSFRIYDKNGMIMNIKNAKAQHYYNGKKVSEYKFGKYHNRTYNLPEVEKKILILGDSFTFGWLINDNKTFVYKLNEKIKEFDFINSSTGGWGSSDQLRFFIDNCKLIKPEFSIVFINFNDIDRSLNSNLFHVNENNDLVEGKNEIVKLKILLNSFFLYNFLIEKSHTINFLKRVFLDTHYYNVAREDKDLAQYKKGLINKKEFLQRKEKEKSDNRIKKKIKDFKIIEYEYSRKAELLAEKIYQKFQEYALRCNTNLIFINLGWYDYNLFNSHTNVFLRENNFFNNNDLKLVDLNEDLTEIHNNYQKFTLSDGHPNNYANNYLFNIIYKRIKPIIEK